MRTPSGLGGWLTLEAVPQGHLYGACSTWLVEATVQRISIQLVGQVGDVELERSLLVESVFGHGVDRGEARCLHLAGAFWALRAAVGQAGTTSLRPAPSL